MIRLVVIDRRPVMRLGLEGALRAHADVAVLGAASHEERLWPLLYRADPDVVLIGDAGPPGIGAALALCQLVKRRHPAARVVLLATAGPDLAVPAALAGADGPADPGAPARDLAQAIRDAGAAGLPVPPLRAQAAAAARLDPVDHPIFAMRLAGTATREIAQTLGLARGEPASRLAAMVARLAGGLSAAPAA